MGHTDRNNAHVPRYDPLIIERQVDHHLEIDQSKWPLVLDIDDIRCSPSAGSSVAIDKFSLDNHSNTIFVHDGIENCVEY